MKSKKGVAKFERPITRVVKSKVYSLEVSEKPSFSQVPKTSAIPKDTSHSEFLFSFDLLTATATHRRKITLLLSAGATDLLRYMTLRYLILMIVVLTQILDPRNKHGRIIYELHS